MPETQPKEQSAKVIPMTINDLIVMQVRDLKEEFRDSRKELSERMERLERRQDKLEEKITKLDAKIDKLADKIDRLKDTIVTPTLCERINITALVAVAVGVLYAVFFK